MPAIAPSAMEVQGQGGDEGPLVGGQGTLRTPKPLKTVGSYWPYATTLSITSTAPCRSSNPEP